MPTSSRLRRLTVRLYVAVSTLRKTEKVDMRYGLLVAALFGALSFSSARAGETPTPNEVQAWWKATSSDEMEINGPLQEVRLMNKEVAFIAPAVLSGRGRNGMWRAVLVRPQLKEVRELPEPVGDRLSVLDLEGDGVSEVVSVEVTSGQGQTDSFRSIFKLDGFTPVVLHAALEEDNLGEGRKDYEKVSLDWKFGRQLISGLISLTETITTSKGPREDRLKSRREVRRYVLVGNIFVRADAASLRNPDDAKARATDHDGQSE